MRFRILLLAVLFTLGFFWVTSRANWKIQSLTWSDPIAVHGSGLTPEEQNNIDVYKYAKLATVYITSTAVRRDFFFQPVAQQSLGSGFLINDEGFILTNFHVISGSRDRKSVV